MPLRCRGGSPCPPIFWPHTKCLTSRPWAGRPRSQEGRPCSTMALTYYSGHHILNCIAIVNVHFLRTYCSRQRFPFRVQAPADEASPCRTAFGADELSGDEASPYGIDRSPGWGGSISSPGRSLRSPGSWARHPIKALSRAALLRFGLEPPLAGLKTEDQGRPDYGSFKHNESSIVDAPGSSCIDNGTAFNHCWSHSLTPPMKITKVLT